MPGRPLPEAAINRLVGHGSAEFALLEMRVVTGAPGRWIPPLFKAGAMTFGRTVLFRRGQYAPQTARGLALIGHEAGHITQWRDLGVPRFLVRYSRGLMTARFVHARHPLERPLNELQRDLRAALEAEGG
jgi:hypothetical protein